MRNSITFKGKAAQAAFEVLTKAKPPLATAQCSAADLRVALEESVKLQSHYAILLNGLDEGQRIHFGDAAAWIAYLCEIGTLQNSNYATD